MASTHDLVVLGAGSGGYPAALRAAQLGLRVALVEVDRVGGTCLHRGCIPTKAWLHAAEVADAARDSAQFGVHASLDKVDLAGVRDYADAVVQRLYRGLSGLVATRGVEVVTGRGRILPGPEGVGVEVDGRVLRAPRTVLATGSVPKTLGLPVDGARVLTSEQALRLDTLPASVVVLGGGVIGVEFASAWRSFGVEVTVVEALDRLVPAEEPELSAALLRSFRRRGVVVRTATEVTAVTPGPRGVGVRLRDGTELTADLVLVAVGRGPNGAGLGLAEAGIATSPTGHVEVDHRLRTSVPGVVAVGDLVAGLQLAHRGFAHGIFVAEEAAAALGRTPTPPPPVPDTELTKVTYCDPEIASVGLGEAAARERFGDVQTVTYDLAGNGRSQILRTSGLVKLVRQPAGPVVGVHMIGARIGELAGEAQLITGWTAFPEDVAPLLHAHPTQAEALGEAHLALAGKPLHRHS